MTWEQSFAPLPELNLINSANSFQYLFILLMMDDYPTLETYQQQMYQQYLDKQNWLKKLNGQPQDKGKYYKARAARWTAMSRVRQAYGL